MRSKANIVQLLLNGSAKSQQLIWMLSLVLSCFQATSWFSVTLISFLILRYGIKSMWNLMCANFVVNGIALYVQGMDVGSAWVTAAFDYWPAYVGAIALLLTRSWHLLAYTMMVFSALIGVMLHLFAPDFGLMHYQMLLDYVVKLHHPLVNEVFNVLKNHQKTAVSMIIGMQIMFAHLNALTSLTFAHSWLSRDQHALQFHDELLHLRASQKLLLAFSIAVFLVWNLAFAPAWYVLPSLAMYFIAIGGSILFSLLPKTKLLMSFFVAIILFLLMPYVCIPVLFGIGALDSFVNFRFLFAKRIKTTV